MILICLVLSSLQDEEKVKVDQTVVHGDYVDDRDTIVKDSVINRSNIGAGGSSKMQELKELKEMFDSGFISKEEMDAFFDSMTQGMLVVLGEKNIKKLKDFADLSSDELIGGADEIKGKRIKIDGYLEDFALTREEADNLIMSARKIVYEN